MAKMSFGPEMECTSTFYLSGGACTETSGDGDKLVCWLDFAGLVKQVEKAFSTLSGMFLSTDACRYYRMANPGGDDCTLLMWVTLIIVKDSRLKLWRKR